MAFEIHSVPSWEDVDYSNLTNAPFKFEMGLFDKFQPLWKFCQSLGVPVHYFDDFEINWDQIRAILLLKEGLIGECLQRKPFGEESNQSVIAFFGYLEAARKDGNRLIGLCD